MQDTDAVILPEKQPKFKKGQVVMMATGKKDMAFLIRDVTSEDGEWFYAFNRKNYVHEPMIRALTKEEAGD